MSASAVIPVEKPALDIVHQLPGGVEGQSEPHVNATLAGLPVEVGHQCPSDKSVHVGAALHADAVQKQERHGDRLIERRRLVDFSHSASSCDCFDPVFCGYHGCSRIIRSIVLAAAARGIALTREPVEVQS